MKVIENLWPQNLGESSITMPKEILLQQANYLADITKNIIIAEVKTNQGVLANTDEKIMVHEFIIKAPSMGNYRFPLMRIMHNFNIYPVRIFNALTEEITDTHSEEEFILGLSNILKSEKTSNAINSIIAQSL